MNICAWELLANLGVKKQALFKSKQTHIYSLATVKRAALAKQIVAANKSDSALRIHHLQSGSHFWRYFLLSTLSLSWYRYIDIFIYIFGFSFLSWCEGQSRTCGKHWWSKRANKRICPLFCQCSDKHKCVQRINLVLRCAFLPFLFAQEWLGEFELSFSSSVVHICTNTQ